MKNKIAFSFILLALPILTKAQTGGPGQPEFMQFQQAGTSDLVSLTSGAFTYQIPLFTIGGYPMNLTYQSGIMMEDVASMVGLGWNLNAGSIVRNLRGIPDDDSGDVIVKDYSVQDNTTYGGKLDVDLEIAGLPLGVSVGAGLGVFYNNYKGWGMEPSLRCALSASFSANHDQGGTASLGMGISANSQTGVDRYISPSIGLKLGTGSDKLGISLGKTWSVNSTEGLKESINGGLSIVRYSKDATVKGIDSKGNKGLFKDQSSASILGLTHTSYLNNSFQPDIDYPFVNTSGTYSGTLGGDGYFVDPSVRVTGYFSAQRLATRTQTFGAYGAMYESNDIPENSLEDKNTEKKLPYFFGQSKILPISYKTPDLFNLNAQGLSMTFSFSKNDIGVVSDPKGVVTSIGTQAGLEVNLGELFKAGGNFGTTNSYQLTERWQKPDGTTSIPFLEGQAIMGTFPSQTLYQQYCFKNHGELNSLNRSLFTTLGMYSPVRFELANESYLEYQLTSPGANTIIPGNLWNRNQPVRQSSISYLTAGEASTMGFDKMINYYTFQDPTADPATDVLTPMPRIDPTPEHIRKPQHLSEISVTQPDGKRYIFGLPVYNDMQKEVTFTRNPNASTDPLNNLVGYTPGTDNSISNSNGIDHFFEATTTPPYATQFLITAVLSPDYRDLTGDGISDDDAGNYVKFTYYKDENYHWRTPYATNEATYNRGMRSDPYDDKGMYTYGEKETFYLRTVESKTEIAVYHYSIRDDAIGVLGENGGKDVSQTLRKLDSISIYSLPDWRAHESAATPIKTIHFTYDYSLCNGGPSFNTSSVNTSSVNTSNNYTGKLTLRSVSFSYEKSKKGLLTPYTFAYGNVAKSVPLVTVNPDYHTRDVNKWGYYQPNPSGAYSDCDDATPLSNIDFPYASQDKSSMDRNAYAWNLTNITIPGGGKLGVEYESLDYAYVQDKPAGQMFIVTGISDSLHEPPPGDATLGDIMTNGYNHPKDRLYFNLTSTPPSTNQDQWLQQNYIGDIKDGFLYYKFYVNLRDENYDYITGYAKITGYGIADQTHGYVDLMPTEVDDNNWGGGCNPIQKSALQYMRINRNALIYSSYQPPPATNFGTFITELKAIIGTPGQPGEIEGQLRSSTIGVNLWCLNPVFPLYPYASSSTRGSFCYTVDLTKSFIRLYNPIKKKLAGGARVKTVTINDAWDAMTGNTDPGSAHPGKTYSTSYDYTTTEKDPITGEDVPISSGVADYEPLIGGDEIPLKQPIFYSDQKKMAPDNDYYVETPVDESLFPAPQITYGKVTQSTNTADPSVYVGNPPVATVGMTGKIVNEFFTAKDYPVKVGMTDVDEKRDKSEFNPIQPPFVAIDQEHDFASVSQGFSIELNNMSGQPKATWVYNQNGDTVSGETYEYFPNNENVPSIDRTGKVSHDKRLGVSVEYTFAAKRSFDHSTTSTFSANFNAAEIIFPLFMLMPLYSEMTEEKQFQSFTINKEIRRNGVLKKKTVYEQTSSVSTENLAFDEITGEALLTKTTNEFNDSLFSFKYPAWWMYGGMGPAYTNDRLSLDPSTITSSTPYSNSPYRFLNVGDELRSVSSSTPERLWVKDISSFYAPTFEDESGNYVPSPAGKYQIYTPAAKNALTSSAGQVVTWNSNPIDASGRLKFDRAHILNSSAIEYYDHAVSYCDTCEILAQRIGKNNFCAGKEGTWKPLKTWFYLGDRTAASITGGLTDIRTQGIFKTYHDFWVTVGMPGSPWFPDNSNWEWKEKVDLTDIDGQTIQTQDRIGRKVTNLLGYKNSLITAQANNSGYGEAFFDGFEDYYYAYCPLTALKRDGPVVDSDGIRRLTVVRGKFSIVEQSHSGKYSLEVLDTLLLSILPPRDCQGFPMRPDTEQQVEPVYTDQNEAASATTAIDSRDLSVHDTNCFGCAGGFFPLKGKKYLFSCWVKVDHTQPIISCSDATVVIDVPGGTSATLHSEGPVIEDWQRIEGTFTTAPNSNQLSITLKKGTARTYYDDIRIIPADGNMISYVYDDVNLRMTYSLDENNYFTKNEYNNQGELIRIKKETEKGIITQKEGYQALVKH